jgi:acetyl esterase/lipase
LFAELLIAVGLILGLQATAISANRNEPITAATAVLEDHYPQQRSRFANGVVGLGNLTYYALSGFRPLTLDLYLPPSGKRNAAATRPLVIYIHGGGWVGGHSRNSGAFVDFPGVLASLAARGYVVSSLNYRLSSEAPFPAAIQDVKAAIRWLRAHADEYGIDRTRVMVWGGSAGGQLAGLATTSCGIAALDPALATDSPSKAESDCVQGAVLWYSVLDFDTLIQAQTRNVTGPVVNPTSRYLGCELTQCAAETVRLASAFSQINANTPPILLIHGADDQVVPPAQSQAFYDKLKATTGKSELLMIPDVDHSFIGKTTESTHAASILALNKTFAFIDATIGTVTK